MFWEKPEPFVMGILNITPDSFFDGGKYVNPQKAKERALQMIEQGADILDIGGESTRPGSEKVSLQEEVDRVCPVIETIRKESTIPISLDTSKSGVVQAAIQVGSIDVVNDVTALSDPDMAHTIVESGADVVLMHMQGTPQSMQENPTYIDLIEDLKIFFHERIRYAEKKGIHKEKILIDPGIGFGKKVEHNLEIFKRLEELVALKFPLLMAPSRKSFIGHCLEDMEVDRSWGTAAAVAISIQKGARGIRVHDVKEMKQVLQVATAFQS